MTGYQKWRWNAAKLDICTGMKAMTTTGWNGWEKCNVSNLNEKDKPQLAIVQWLPTFGSILLFYFLQCGWLWRRGLLQWWKRLAYYWNDVLSPVSTMAVIRLTGYFCPLTWQWRLVRTIPETVMAKRLYCHPASHSISIFGHAVRLRNSLFGFGLWPSFNAI